MKLRNPAIAWLLAVSLCIPWAARAQSVSESVEPGDVLQIEVYAGGEKQNDFTVTVSSERTIVCPLVGAMAIDSSGTMGIGTRLREQLARDFYVDPQVLVSVKSRGARVFVLGEVKHPGTYLLSDAPTLMGAYALTGGFTDFAAPQHARIARSEGGRVRFIDVDFAKVRRGKAEDVRLRGGDRLEIPHRLF